MFGLSLGTLISLVVTYGPEAISFVKAADPLLHQLAVAAGPLAKKLITSGATHEEAVTQSVADIADRAYKASYEDKAVGNR